MVRKNIYIREDQVIDLAKLPGNESEHIRAALDEYIKKRFTTFVTVSPSKLQKGVMTNGKFFNVQPSPSNN